MDPRLTSIVFSGLRFSGGLLESGFVVCESGSVADFSASERSRLSLARVGRVWERYSVKEGGWRETGWKAESRGNTRYDTCNKNVTRLYVRVAGKHVYTCTD